MAESHNVEYKEIWKDEYLKWLCGFANSKGGSIFVGVDDNGNVVGVKTSISYSKIFPIKFSQDLALWLM